MLWLNYLLIHSKDTQNSAQDQLRLVIQEVDEETQKASRFLKVSNLGLGMKILMCLLDILDSLFYDEIYDRYDKIAEAYEKTFEWIYDNPGPGFVSWLQEGQGVYWIRGKPGCGKSTLMKYILRDPRTGRYLQEGLPTPSRSIGGFFLHDRGSSLQKSLNGLLRAMLHQLLSKYRDLILKVLPMFSKTKQLGKATLWSRQQELLDALNAVISQDIVAGEICFFIDGLDEYDRDHFRLLSYLIKLVDPLKQGTLKLKLCISSRPLYIFHDSLQRFPKFIV